MSIFDKLKNALFEEEYVEVEEKPKVKKPAKMSIKDTIKEKQKSREKEKPVAKKIVLPEKREVVVSDVNDEAKEEKKIEIQDIREAPPIPVVEEKKEFKIMEDDDFKITEDYYPSVEPQIVKVIDKEEEASSNLYKGGLAKERPKKPYGIDETPHISVHEYGTYERRDDRGYFKPSPIISPIYGILDKNYKKDDIVTKKEVRLTSNYAKERLNVDDVRNKAYGDLADTIKSLINKEQEKTKEQDKVEEEVEDKPTFDVEKDDNLLVDLTSDVQKPAVKEVTVGDAVEYFQDLGLEYNVDYMDAAKKTTGRRAEKKKTEEAEVEAKMEEPELPEVKEEAADDSDDNLFDLIDSMYRDNE